LDLKVRREPTKKKSRRKEIILQKYGKKGVGCSLIKRWEQGKQRWEEEGQGRRKRVIRCFGKTFGQERKITLQREGGLLTEGGD